MRRRRAAQAGTALAVVVAVGVVPATQAHAAEGGSCPAFTDAAGGGYHSLAVAAGGRVWSWGSNSFGQLGNGTTTARNSPGPAAVTDATAVSAGAQHSLALAVDGTVWSWGYNNSGQLGNGSASSSNPNPGKVSGLSNVTAIAAGGYHSLALRADGSVRAWGSRSDGQVGDGVSSTTPRPTEIQVATGMTAVAAGQYHSLALGADGRVWAWGYNSFGQLGLGHTTSKNVPTVVPGLTGITAIGAGSYHSLAVGSGGTVYAWGWNGSGQVGDNTTVNKSSPTATSLTGVSAVEGGGFHSLALLTTGGVRAWGGNSYGQVGDDTTVTKKTPVVPSWSETASMVAGGETHSLAVTASGEIYGWGDSTDGQVGNGTNAGTDVPVSVLCAPTLGTVTDGPDPVSVSESLTFTVGWTAANPNAQVRAVVCKTAAVSAGACAGGTWAVGNLESRSPSSASYTPVSADVGEQTYHAFACDATNVCSPSATSTFHVVAPQCADGMDNDADGATDFPNDSGCSAPSDTTELGPPQCSDGLDNDADGISDYPAEPDCSNELDTNEQAGFDPPKEGDQVWTVCSTRLLANGVVVLVASAYAFSDSPAHTTTVDCTTTGNNGETLRAAATSVGPLVVAVSSRVMAPARLHTCWSATALWTRVDGLSASVPHTEPQRCTT